MFRRRVAGALVVAALAALAVNEPASAALTPSEKASGPSAVRASEGAGHRRHSPVFFGTRRFYVDPQGGNDSDSGRTTRRPWRTLDRLEQADLRPGDTVALKRGATFTGSTTLAASGTSRRPIGIRAYGRGDEPTLTNPGGLNMLYVTGDNVHISGLRFTDGVSFDDADGKGITGEKYIRSGAVAIATGADDVVVEDNLFTDLGLGVKTYGLGTRITHNTFRDLRIAFRGFDSGSEASYGALGVSLNHSDADVGWNTFINCRSTDSPYGADGGAVEIEGQLHTKDRIRIHHNVSSGSQGFLETTETASTDVLLSYNVSDDYQQFVAFDTTTTPSRYRAEHNTVLRRSSRNTTALFAVLFYRDEGPLPTADWISLRDNIFYVPSQKVLSGSYTYKRFEFPHDHNVMAGQVDPLGYPLGVGDIIADPRFAGRVPDLPQFVTDPRQLAPRADSPAIDRGVARPEAADVLGNRIRAHEAPDAGAVEFTGRKARYEPDPPVILGGELLSDGDFERQAPGPIGEPWNGGDSVVVEDGDLPAAHSGRRSARISGPDGFRLLSRVVDVETGQRYRLTQWLRTQGDICSTCIYYGVKTLEGEVVTEFAGYADAEWKALDVDFVAPDDQVIVQMGYFPISPASALLTDDWSLRTASRFGP